MAQQQPMIRAVASRIKSGEVFYVTGTGFTPDRAAISHLIRPDKTEYNPLRLRANTSGEIVHKIDTVMPTSEHLRCGSTMKPRGQHRIGFSSP